MDTSDKKEVSNIPIPVLITALILFFWAIGHTIQTRPSTDILKYSLYIIAAVFVIFSVIMIVLAFQGKVDKPRKGDLVMYLATIIAIFLIGPIYYSVGASIKDLYLWIQSPQVPKSGAIIMILAITSILGVILFYFRLRARSIYGITEAGIGLTVAAYKVASEDSQTLATTNFYLVILTASVYLVVRGLDNIHQGLTKEPIDQYMRKLILFFKAKR